MREEDSATAPSAHFAPPSAPKAQSRRTWPQNCEVTPRKRAFLCVGSSLTRPNGTFPVLALPFTGQCIPVPFTYPCSWRQQPGCALGDALLSSLASVPRPGGGGSLGGKSFVLCKS